MKKTCKYYHSICDRPINDGKGGLPKCKGFNEKCQIITPRKKAKTGREYVQVKAWAHPDIFTSENPLVWVARNKSPVYSMPVTITGDRKDIRRKL